jgi:allantoate deiminase
MSSLTNLAIDRAELEELIVSLGRVGALASGGLFRPVYGDAWLEAIALIEQWAFARGLPARRDALGNLYVRLEGRSDGPVVLTGSHIDTVRSGGRFDGALGVVGGLLALAALKRHSGQPDRTIELVALCEEEGSRFHANFLGSRAITGTLKDEELDQILDDDGLSIADGMLRIGLDPGRVNEAKRADIGAYIELHIEQGRVLQDHAQPIGLVHTITGIRHAELRVTGRVDHAGTTPMRLRHDAGLAAAEMMLAAARAAEDLGPPSVATVGQLQLGPGAINIVPGWARLTLDARHPDATQLARLVTSIERSAGDIAELRDVDLTITPLVNVPPAPMDEGLLTVLRDSVQSSGLSAVEMASGAGHDAQIMASRFPSAMIFVPSLDGRSHCPEEYTSTEDAARGVEVLAAALYRLAY